MTKMATMPICMVETLQKSSSLKLVDRFPRNLKKYEASGTPVHYGLFKWWPWVDSDNFYGKVIFFFNLGLSESSGYIRNYCSLLPESG